MTELKKHRSYLIWLLARKDYPRRQLEEKLKKREVSSSDIKTLLDQLITEGWFYEGTFKKVRTRQLIRRGYGPRMIQAKLRTDRLSIQAEEINVAYSELGSSSEQHLKELIEKYQRRYESKKLPPRELKHKIVQALMRKGFDASSILKELKGT